MITADQIKANIASYWRYVKQCPVVALEVNSQLGEWTGEAADVLAVNKNRYLIETEVKVSMSDLKRDVRKRKHIAFRAGHSVTRYFYFAVPIDIANNAKDICADLYPYAGILGTNGLDEYGVKVYRQAKPLSGKKLNYSRVLRIIYGQSSTVCRFARQIEELLRVQKDLHDQLKYYKDMEKLEELARRNEDGAHVNRVG